MNIGKEYKYDPETCKFVEVQSSKFRVTQKIILLSQIIALITLLFLFFNSKEQNKYTAYLSSFQEISTQRDSAEVIVSGDSLQLSNENTKASIKEIKDSIERLEGRVENYSELDSLYEDLENSVNEYEVAFQEMSEIGLDDAVSVPILQQKVSSLDHRIDWIWQVYWGTAITIIVGIVGIYISLLRKSYITMESYYEQRDASESG